MRKLVLTLTTILILLAACAPNPTIMPAPTQTSALKGADATAAEPTFAPPANLPNPASVFCESKGYRVEIRTAADGSQSGVCIFPNGECDEWAYFRGECAPASPAADKPTEPAAPAAPTAIPTPLPILPEDYQGFWTYTHPTYKFTIMLPEDWNVSETTTADPLMNGHQLILRPKNNALESIRLTFRRTGEDVPLWPTGVGSGEFVSQGTLQVAGQPARRILFVCPTGNVTAIWYQDGREGQPNIQRGGLEFAFIYSYGICEPGSTASLGGKVQRVGEMIIASLKAP